MNIIKFFVIKTEEETIVRKIIIFRRKT